jgi:RNA polymerase primary sigma factor
MSKKYVNFDAEESISKYFKEVRKTKMITSDEEVMLANRIGDGDQKAIGELVTANLKFVVSIAKDYQGQGLALSDLISDGNLGLMKAATKFDHTRGFKFISYAVWWVRQSIIQGLNDNARIVRLPTNVIHKLSYLKKEISKFEYANEREPVFGEIFDKENHPMPLLSFPKCGSLNDVINEDGDELATLIADEDDDDGTIIIDDRLKTELDKTLSILSERERDIIEHYYGVNTECEPMTLEAIGERYGLTKERIRQIKEKSLRKLRYNATNLHSLINE